MERRVKMKFKYLGTAAAEGIPAIYCTCKVCRNARELGKRELRSRSQALVDDELLLDFPCDTYWHVITYGIDLTKIKHILITHSHDDHFYPLDMNYIRKGFAHLPEDFEPVTVYGNQEVGAKLPLDENNFMNPDRRIRFAPVKPFEALQAGSFLITPLPACHGTKDPMIYLLQKGGKSILYAHDTGKIFPEVIRFLKEKGVVLNLISLDCTEADKTINYNSHMNLERNIVCRNEMQDAGIVSENTVCVLNHFSHNGGRLYRDFVKIAAKEGFLVSYDGLEICL